MNREMIDCTHTNVQLTKRLFPDPALIAVYLTGSPDIKWTPADRAEWPDTLQVTIDQGAQGSPVATAMVRDVEVGAWTPESAVDTRYWRTPRPTIYCNRSTLPNVINAGWHGDVWLADPDYSSDTAPEFPGVNVVAVQNYWGRTYDRSTVYDDTWPVEVTGKADMIHDTLLQGADKFIPFPAGSFKQIMLYKDFTDARSVMGVRVAYHSRTAGYTVLEETIHSSEPVTVTFAHPDVDAVSLVNHSSSFYCGITVA